MNAEINIENNITFFYRNNELIFRSNNYVIDSYAFQSHKLCIFQLFVDEIFDIVYDAVNDYVDFYKCYERLIFLYFIRELFKQFRVYLRHCSNC